MTLPTLMAIVNVTPDSFSGDGLWRCEDVVSAAVARARQMVEEGAEILDVGGESTRPGATGISEEEEKIRVIPVIAALRCAFPSLPISVDTMKPSVARAAIDAGATIINDVSGAMMDDAMFSLAAERGVHLVLMHNRAQTELVCQSATVGGEYAPVAYRDVMADVIADLSSLTVRAMDAGVSREKVIVDPGIGFGKSVEDNLRLIAQLDRIKAMGFPVLLGPSRKSFIGRTLDLPPEDRMEGTAAALAIGLWNGADMVRVHDVKAMSRIVRMTHALLAQRGR